MRILALPFFALLACTAAPIAPPEHRSCRTTVDEAMSSGSLVERDDSGDGAVTYEFDVIEEGRAATELIECEFDRVVSVSRWWEISSQLDASEFFARLHPKLSESCSGAQTARSEFEGPFPTMEARAPGGEIMETFRSRPVAQIECKSDPYLYSLTLYSNLDWKKDSGEKRYWTVDRSSSLAK